MPLPLVQRCSFVQLELASIDPSLSRREVLTKDSQKTLSKEADEAEQGPPQYWQYLSGHERNSTDETA